MIHSPFTSLAERFAAIIGGMKRAVGACSTGRGMYAPASGPLPSKLILLICVWLQRVSNRFAALAARAQDGMRAAPRPRRPASAGPASPSRPGRNPAPPLETWMPGGPKGRLPALPHGFAWLVRLARETGCHGSLLQQLLDDPDMVALAKASPGLGRVLRRLCDALGIPWPAALTAEMPAPRTARVKAACGARGRAPRAEALGGRGWDIAASRRAHPA